MLFLLKRLKTQMQGGNKEITKMAQTFSELGKERGREGEREGGREGGRESPRVRAGRVYFGGGGGGQGGILPPWT